MCLISFVIKLTLRKNYPDTEFFWSVFIQIWNNTNQKKLDTFPAVWSIYTRIDIFNLLCLVSSKLLYNLIKLMPATLFKKTPTQVLSCKIYEIFKNTYFEHLFLRATASIALTILY